MQKVAILVISIYEKLVIDQNIKFEIENKV